MLKYFTLQSKREFDMCPLHFSLRWEENWQGDLVCNRRFVVSLMILTWMGTATELAQSQQAPATFKVTRPPEHTFVPPSPYPDRASPNGTGFWFGTAKLWTSLPANGVWSGLPHYTPDDPTFRQKLFWFRAGYDWHIEPQPKLTITGRRLDSVAPPLAADQANNGWTQRDQPFMVVGINFPTLGCWEVTGHYKDEKLSYVVWVAK